MDIEDRPAPTPFAPADEAKVVVYRGAAVFDGTGAGLRSDAAIVVAGGNIRAVLDNAELSAELLDGAEVVELDGRVVIPGLIDSHQHLATPPNRPVAEATLRRHVYSGVTAIRDMADDLRHIADLTRSTRVGEIAGPDIHYAALMAGPSFFDDPRTWQVSQGETPGYVPWMQAITEDTDLRIAVALARGTHASAVKIYADLPGELVAAITTEAHRQGLSVWAHAAVFPATPLEVVAAGVDVLSHVTMLGYQLQSGSSLTYKGKQPIDPGAVSVDDPRIGDVLDQMRLRGAILDATASMWTRDGIAHGDAETVARGKANADLAAALTARAIRAGVDVSTGTDFETPPDDPFPSLYKELLFLNRRCGMATDAVLRAATQVGARSAGAESTMGTLEAGKLANFVVLDENPLADLTNLESVSCTVKRGHRFARSEYDAHPETKSGGDR
jgi:imidazolonepropionase-like amidohydrolase